MVIEKDKTVWYQNYKDEGVIFFEEFEGGAAYSHIKSLTDAFQIELPNKGGSMRSKAHTIIFASNCLPNVWWPNTDMEPLQRRIEEGGGCVAIWEGGRSDYSPDRVYTPGDIRPATHTWQAYPDPTTEDEDVPRGMFFSKCRG